MATRSFAPRAVVQQVGQGLLVLMCLGLAQAGAASSSQPDGQDAQEWAMIDNGEAEAASAASTPFLFAETRLHRVLARFAPSGAALSKRVAPGQLQASDLQAYAAVTMYEQQGAEASFVTYYGTPAHFLYIYNFWRQDALPELRVLLESAYLREAGLSFDLARAKPLLRLDASTNTLHEVSLLDVAKGQVLTARKMGKRAVGWQALVAELSPARRKSKKQVVAAAAAEAGRDQQGAAAAKSRKRGRPASAARAASAAVEGAEAAQAQEQEELDKPDEQGQRPKKAKHEVLSREQLAVITGQCLTRYYEFITIDRQSADLLYEAEMSRKATVPGVRDLTRLHDALRAIRKAGREALGGQGLPASLNAEQRGALQGVAAFWHVSLPTLAGLMGKPAWGRICR